MRHKLTLELKITGTEEKCLLATLSCINAVNRRMEQAKEI